MTTTKIFKSTLREVKKLAQNSFDQANQAQIIARAVRDYAVASGDYVISQAGLIGVNDEVVFEDGTKAKVTAITENNVMFDDKTVALKSGREIWRIKEVL